MRREELKLANICKLENGVIEELFSAQLKPLINDLLERPGEKKARSVIIAIHLTPSDSTDANCDHVDIQFDVSSRLPKQRTRRYVTSVSRKRGNDVSLGFHPDFVDDPDANGMFDNQEPDQGKDGSQ